MFWVYWKQPVHHCVCVQHANFCESAGGGNKSHLVTALVFIRLWKTGHIMGSPVAVGRCPHSLSGAYLQDYASYGYEISWVDRSHQGGVQCTGIITLACLIFELLHLFIFILEFCPEHISKTILAMVMKFCGWIDLIKGECSAY